MGAKDRGWRPEVEGQKADMQGWMVIQLLHIV